MIPLDHRIVELGVIKRNKERRAKPENRKKERESNRIRAAKPENKKRLRELQRIWKLRPEVQRTAYCMEI